SSGRSHFCYRRPSKSRHEPGFVEIVPKRSGSRPSCFGTGIRGQSPLVAIRFEWFRKLEEYQSCSPARAASDLIVRAGVSSSRSRVLPQSCSQLFSGSHPSAHLLEDLCSPSNNERQPSPVALKEPSWKRTQCCFGILLRSFWQQSSAGCWRG